MGNSPNASQRLQALLAEALELLSRDKISADALKDWHYVIAKAFRPAIEEIRQTETPPPHWTDGRESKGDYSGVG